jgi:hypothetical protein
MPVQLRSVITVSHSQPAPKKATGSDLYRLMTAMRRKGYTASFGVDKDPKVVQK